MLFPIDYRLKSQLESAVLALQSALDTVCSVAAFLAR
jgi:hypothetical protein